MIRGVKGLGFRVGAQSLTTGARFAHLTMHVVPTSFVSEEDCRRLPDFCDLRCTKEACRRQWFLRV